MSFLSRNAKQKPHWQAIVHACMHENLIPDSNLL